MAANGFEADPMPDDEEVGDDAMEFSIDKEESIDLVPTQTLRTRMAFRSSLGSVRDVKTPWRPSRRMVYGIVTSTALLVCTCCASWFIVQQNAKIKTDTEIKIAASAPSGWRFLPADGATRRAARSVACARDCTGGPDRLPGSGGGCGGRL